RGRAPAGDPARRGTRSGGPPARCRRSARRTAARSLRRDGRRCFRGGGGMMRVDAPEIVEQVLAASDRYEAALAAGDVETLNGLFWTDDRVRRIGDADLQTGHDEISAYRRTAGSAPVDRTNDSRRVIALGEDVAIVDIFSSYPDDTREGRQTQV